MAYHESCAFALQESRIDIAGNMASLNDVLKPYRLWIYQLYQNAKKAALIVSRGGRSYEVTFKLNGRLMHFFIEWRDTQASIGISIEKAFSLKAKPKDPGSSGDMVSLC